MVILLGLLALLASCSGVSVSQPDSLVDMVQAFACAPDTTRTKVWWFHGETETTREGITADLEAYRRAGVGGVVYYDQVHNKTTAGAIEAFSPAWWQMLRFSASEARRLGLTFECHVSNGYVAGGPWVTPDMAMQRLTTTDTMVQGGGNVELSLPVPPSSYYKDVAVLAYPVSDDATDSRVVAPKVSSNIVLPDVPKIFEEGNRLIRIPAQDSTMSVYLNLDFGQNFTARSITYQVAPRGKATTSATNVPGEPGEHFVGTGYRILPPLGQLEASDDGVHYRVVCDLLPVYKAHSSWRQKTISFPTVTARYFRLNLHDWNTPDKPRLHMQIGDVSLSPEAKIDQWEEKAALYSEYIAPDRTPCYTAAEIIDEEELIDLTDRVDTAGVLRWNAPSGWWRVLRFAHVPTGAKTKHGRPNLMGLECDKMSAAAARLQWSHYFGAIADTLYKYNIPLHGMAMDSHEAGSQNWTPGFEQQFAHRRGYDLRKYLPVMAGYVVGSVAESAGVLYDVRRTIADLIADNYYATFDSLCCARGLDFTAQATGNALCIVADPIQAKGRVSKPQGEFWAIHPDGNYDIKECSSAAHLYGKPIASGEAFTDVKFSQSLAYIKSLADYAYCYGINEFVVCASAYQPWLDRVPGNTGGGRHYCLHRNNTYWPYSRGFWDYQSRCAYMMRQGRPVVDLAVYLGENAPVKILTYRLPDIPAGYDFDAFTSDALFSRMSACDGVVVLPHGMTYRMIVLPRDGEITLAALQKIASFVRAGVPVYGARPIGSPSRVDRGQEAEYSRLVAEIWGENPAPEGVARYGRGQVYWGMPLEQAVRLAGIAPDVKMLKGDTKRDKLYFAHRTTSEADIYFFDNHTDRVIDDTIVLRTARKYAEMWSPVEGRRYRLSVRNDSGLVMPLRWRPREAYFVVVTDTCDATLPTIPRLDSTQVEPIRGDWRVTFAEAMGGVGEVCFPQLVDWTSHANPAIKYYSGTALYRNTKTLRLPRTDERVFLSFARLCDVARVVVNGREVDTVWCSPWEVDITEVVREGDNTFEIYVTNSLLNRMIGDASLPADERYTYAYPSIVKPGDALVPSGIIGEVCVEYRKR